MRCAGGDGGFGLCERFGDAEVGQDERFLPGPTGRIGSEQHGRGLEIPVHHPQPVGGLEAGGDVDTDLTRLFDGELEAVNGPLAHPFLQRPAVGDLHNEVGAPIGKFAHVMDRDDVGRIGVPEDLGLLHEPPADVLILRPVVSQHFDGDRRFQVVVMGQPHRCECPAAQHTFGAIATDLLHGVL